MNNKKDHLIKIAIIICVIMLVLIILFLTNLPQSKNKVDLKLVSNENGIVANIWIEGESRLDKLKQNNIKYLFVDVGDTSNEGKLTTPEDEIKSFLGLIKEYESSNNYNFILLPYSEIIMGEYNLSPEFQKNFIKDYNKLAKLGFNGVFLDIEKIPLNQRQNYLELIEKLKQTLQENAILSVYAGSISKDPNEWEWDINFYKKVSDNVNIIVLPGYDTEIENEEEYQTYIANQIDQINSKTWKSNFLFGVPTHKEAPETIANALEVYKEKIKLNDNNFIGVSIFSEWTISEDDWKRYREYF